MGKHDDPWYRQCRFECQTDRGKKIDTAWIPEESARIGNKIFINEDWADQDLVWTITHVFARQPKSWVVLHRQDHKHQRKASDI